MPLKRKEPEKKRNLTQDIQELMRRRGIKQEAMAVSARKHVEIQLLLSELENLLLNMSAVDKRVIAAKAKLRDLKKLIASTLDVR